MFCMFQSLPRLAGEVSVRDEERVLVYMAYVRSPPGYGVNYLYWTVVTAPAQPQVERPGLDHNHVGGHAYI